ncbi:MAG: phosphatidylserine decarboxylase, partial [Luteolibacter sp.]
IARSNPDVVYALIEAEQGRMDQSISRIAAALEAEPDNARLHLLQGTLALRQRLAYLWENKRVVARIDSDRCGSVWLIEIGATCVGSIRQTFTPEKSVTKGEEKGYFEFGGSSVITLFEPGAVVLDQDLLQCSADQTELYARFGTRMGRIA